MTLNPIEDGLIVPNELREEKMSVQYPIIVDDRSGCAWVLLVGFIVATASACFARESPFADAEEPPKAVMTLVDAAGQTIGEEIDSGRMIIITTEKSEHDGVEGSLRWRVEGTSQFHVYPDKSSAVIVSETEGIIRIQLIAAKGGRSDDQVVLIRCGRGPMPPPGPVPPPTPVPPPGPSPKPLTGLRVLIVYENGATLTREQLAVLNSTVIMSLLNERCAKTQTGQSEWRKWDKSSIDKTGVVERSKEKGRETWWRDFWTAESPKITKLPTVIISSDQGVTGPHPLPETEAKAVELLNKITTGGK